MDDLLSGGKSIKDRKTFFDKVNRRLKGPQISINSFDKDLKDLKELVEDRTNNKVTVQFSRDGGYRYSDPNFAYYTSAVNRDDQYLLELAINLFQVFKGTSMEEQYARIVDKVMSESINGGIYTDKERNEYIQMTTKMALGSGKWIDKLLKAIFHKDALEIQYKNSKGIISKKIISPYALKHHQNHWYLVAHDQLCERPDKTNVFSVDNIQRLEYSNKNYILEDFSLNDYFKYSLGIWHLHEKDPVEVVLEFNKKMDYIRNTPLHHTQKESYDEVRNVLTVTITVYQTPELEMLIQGFGNSVTVISPQSLINRIKENAQEVLKLYK